MCNICARCSKTMLVFWEILLSLSARRVWIEMQRRKGGQPGNRSHSPRGGCGLKLGIQDAVEDSMKVTLREEGVD